MITNERICGKIFTVFEIISHISVILESHNTCHIMCFVRGFCVGDSNR